MNSQYHALPAPGPERDFEHAMREWDEATRVFLTAPISIEAVDAYLNANRAAEEALLAYTKGGTA